jgi:hypothetical protein
MNCTECQKQNAQFRCNKCLITPFCSVQCQTKNWNKEHAVKCDIIGKECHNETDLITLENIPADHFDLYIGEKKYCFEFEALALWIQSQIMRHPVNPRPDHPNTIRYLVEHYEIENNFRPNNPVTNAKFTNEQLLRFADAYEAYLFRNNQVRRDYVPPIIIRQIEVFSVDIYADNGSYEGWDIARTEENIDYNFWRNGVAVISNNYLQQNSLQYVLEQMRDIKVMDTETGEILEPESVYIDMSIMTNGNLISLDDQLQYNANLFDYNDIKICFQAALYQLNQENEDEDEITEERLEAEMRNGTTTVELRIGYYFREEDEENSDSD